MSKRVTLCGEPTDVIGAGACPREHGHPGDCYWWIAFELGASWRVVVYSGEPQERVPRCRGAFVDDPGAGDVYWLLVLIAELNAREDRRHARR